MRTQAVRTICAIAPDCETVSVGGASAGAEDDDDHDQEHHNNKRRSGSISPPLPGHCSCVAKLEARVDVDHLKPDATDEPIEEALEILSTPGASLRQPRVGPPVERRPWTSGILSMSAN